MLIKRPLERGRGDDEEKKKKKKRIATKIVFLHLAFVDDWVCCVFYLNPL